VVTGYLWRPPEEMGKYFGSLLFGQALLSIAFCAIYAFLVGNRACVQSGMIYGLLAGVLLCGPNFITFAVQPMPFYLMMKWSIGRLLQTALAGLVLGLIYRATVRVSESSSQALAA
jgi:hypothetical protein